MSLYVICYDVPDYRRRTRISHALEGYGHRVQKSIFECDLDARRLTALRHELEALADPHEDKLRYYPLCRKDHALALAWDAVGQRPAQTLWLI